MNGEMSGMKTINFQFNKLWSASLFQISWQINSNRNRMGTGRERSSSIRYLLCLFPSNSKSINFVEWEMCQNDLYRRLPFVCFLIAQFKMEKNNAKRYKTQLEQSLTWRRSRKKSLNCEIQKVPKWNFCTFLLCFFFCAKEAYTVEVDEDEFRHAEEEKEGKKRNSIGSFAYRRFPSSKI